MVSRVGIIKTVDGLRRFLRSIPTNPFIMPVDINERVSLLSLCGVEVFAAIRIIKPEHDY